MKNLNIKQKLHDKCQEFLDQRIAIVQNQIKDIQCSLESETKSSAGDKHETGRAMLQLEREKAGQQLAEIEKQQQILKKIDVDAKYIKVAFGSVVETSNSNYFIAISAGEFCLENTKYIAISVVTPIAQLMISKQIGDCIVFRESEFEILNIH